MGAYVAGLSCGGSNDSRLQQALLNLWRAIYSGFHRVVVITSASDWVAGIMKPSASVAGGWWLEGVIVCVWNIGTACKGVMLERCPRSAHLFTCAPCTSVLPIMVLAR